MRLLLALLWPTLALAGPLDPFSDPDAGFTVMFPSPPERNDHTQVVHGTPAVTHVYTSEAGKLGYVVSWSDHPAAATMTPDTWLQAARDSAVGTQKVISEKTGKVGGAPSRRIVVEKDTVRVTLQLVLKGTRLYQAMVVQPSAEDHQTATNTFLDSFAITATARTTSPPRPAGHPPPQTRSKADGGTSPAR